MELSHGVYIRIALPPGEHIANHIGTRCVATACHQGVALSELCDRHALYMLGWYDTIIDHPIVPLRPDAEEEEVALLQASVPPLPSTPWFINPIKECIIDTESPMDRAENDVEDVTRDYVNTLEQEAPGGIVPRPGLDEQPEHIQRIMEQLEEHGGIEVEEEGPVLYVNTWFLNHPVHRSCAQFRTVRIAGNFEAWHQQFLRRWSDLWKMDSRWISMWWTHNHQLQECSRRAFHTCSCFKEHQKMSGQLLLQWLIRETLLRLSNILHISCLASLSRSMSLLPMTRCLHAILSFQNYNV